jgi:endogenous inhibitor of DNA gyrase (YacG/DUF329 family)
VNCPICKRPVAEQDPFYPFCTERCKLIDLGNWASEAYVISTPLGPDASTVVSKEGPADEEE